MEYLFRRLDYIKKILHGKYLLIFCDYDGTLAPIAKTPDKAVIPKDVKELINRLSQTSDCRIVIISGRKIKDIRNKIRLKNVIYARNHGLEIESPEIKFKSFVSVRFKILISKITDELSNNLSEIKRVFIENKGLSISVHYRLVSGRNVPLVRKIFNKSVWPYFADRRIKIDCGKKVFEVKPPIDWDKGKAVLWIINKLSQDKNIMPIYIGDDKTDEDAFIALKNIGLTIFVGAPKNSHAKYFVRNTKEVLYFLQDIVYL